MITKYQKEQTLTKIKKAYSILSQTTSKAIADHGPVTTWEIGENATPEASTDFAKKYLIPYLNVMKNCENETTGGCEFVRKNWKGSQTILNEKYSRFFLNDGTLVGVWVGNSETSRYVLIYVDINGLKGPNIVGKDYFEMTYYIYLPEHPEYQGKFAAQGMTKTREEIIEEGCNKNVWGWNCLALIMKDDWQIKDDYPW